MTTEFGILGELQVVHDGTARDLGSLRQRGLLARLLVRGGQPLTTERLIEELWPDEVPETARHTLHVYVSRLRRALGEDRDRLASDVAGYRLRVADDELDATRFEQLAASGRAALADGRPVEAADQLRAALDLWRGPALSEFADEPFARTEATRLDQLRLATLEERLGADLELGRHLEVTEELRNLTLEQPYREHLWEQYMLALYRGGRQADALGAYAEARTRLSDELGIEPGPALTSMEQRVLEHDPVLALAPTASVTPGSKRAPGPSNLPLQRTTFVGRERDLAIAAELLSASRLLTLTGAPGAGKTRMALRLASEQADRFPGGTFFVALASVSEPDRLEPAIEAALESAAGDRMQGRQGLVDRLRGRRALLLLDNLEQLPGAAGLVDRLLDALPQLTVLATSRSPLRVPGEQEFPVLPLQVPPAAAVADPTTVAGYDAVALLVTRTCATDPHFEVTRENAAAIAGITARLDGLPLAIELCAGHLRALTPQSLLERLESRIPLLGTSGDAGGRHHTLREAIAWSYELLAPEDQRLFRRLASFAGAFTAEGAAAISGQPLEDTWTGIESLLAQSLLHRPADVGEARFDMLQTLREYAFEQLQTSGELEATLHRHARYYLLLAQRAHESDEPSRSSLQALLPELEEVRAALSRCVELGEHELGLRLASATWRMWQAAGRYAEGRSWLSRLLEGSGPGAVVRADALMALAGLAYWQADYPAAWTAYEEALELYRSAGDRADEAEVLNALSMTATWRGDAARGAELAIEARALFEALGTKAKVGEALMAQGFALWQEHRYDDARPFWEDALAISRELGDDTLAVTQLAGIAGLEFHTGASADATRIVLDALDQACDLENTGLCVWLLDFAAAFAVADQPREAVRVSAAADALRTASGGGKRVEELHIEPARSAARRYLERAELERIWADGRTLDLEAAVGAARALRPV